MVCGVQIRARIRAFWIPPHSRPVSNIRNIKIAEIAHFDLVILI